MPDLKISQLTSAATPLAGTEVLPVVQSGSTVKVAVSDLTAGRAVSASALTASSGNLTFSGTAQRITGDFSNATVANRLIFQSSTVNGGTRFTIIPNGTSAVAGFDAHSSSSDPGGNASRASLVVVGGSDVRVISDINGTGTYLPMTFYTGGSERVRVDTSGNVGIGTTGGAGYRLDVTGTARFTGITRFDNAIDLKTATLNYVYFDDALAFARNGVGERMRIDASGNVGIGTASPGTKLDVFNTGTTTTDFRVRNSTVSLSSFVDSGASYVGASTNHPLLLITNNNERMRIDSSGNVGIGTTSFGASSQVVLAIANATAVPTGNPTGGGVLYVEAGALKYRGSSGTVTTIANA